MVDIVIDEYIEKSTYEYIIKKINNEGALHFSLIDPDPLRQGVNKAAKMAKSAEDAGTDAILIGGSTVFDQSFVDKTIIAIKEKVQVPIIIFPGGISNISQHADAIFFMSLLNSSDPYSIIGRQALASYTIKSYNLEYISMAYLVIEPGGSAGWIGNAKLLPRNKPKLTAAYGSERIPTEHIKTCSTILNIPIIAGGGVENKEDARAFVEAGVDVVVQGTFIENNILKDNGNSLKEIVDEIKNTGKSQKKTFTIK
ncbi:MAG: phosphoglycerol geranylgeranyltransferase [Candidatus Hodarchaeota archaeon]